MSIFLPQLERLTSATTATSTTGALTIPARDIIVCYIRITGYSGGDIASLRFNADSTAANYTSSHITATSATTPPVLARVNNAGTLGHIPIGSTGITVGRVATVTISNIAANRKVITIHESVEQASTAAATIDVCGYGEWLNTAAQITSIEMLTSGGQNMNSGSGIVIFGANF